MFSGWFWSLGKEAGAPPCGNLVNCFIRKSGAPGRWGAVDPQGTTNHESQAAGLPHLQLLASSLGQERAPQSP